VDGLCGLGFRRVLGLVLDRLGSRSSGSPIVVAPALMGPCS
jgi:hypothetical protein